MKLLIVLCLVAVAATAPPSKTIYNDKNVELLNYVNEYEPNGNFKYAFDQTDGTQVQQIGVLKNEGLENEGIAVSGSFSWVGPDGVTYTITYTADDQGYKPEIEQGPGGGVPPGVVASLLG